MLILFKVARVAQKPSSTLTPNDDPQGKATFIVDNWRVPEKVSFLMWMSNGCIKQCSLFVFGVGDLVDVNAYFNVVIYKGP